MENVPIRARRDELLRECDWTQLPDAPISQEKKDEWSLYRQALRDLPQNNPEATYIAEVSSIPKKP